MTYGIQKRWNSDLGRSVTRWDPEYHQGRSAEFHAGTQHEGQQHCDWCNEDGHHATKHPEARAEMAAWQKQAHAEEFPFGDHKPQY